MKTNKDFSYLILGDGRLARQLQHQFQTRKISFHTWSRRDEGEGRCLSLSQVIFQHNSSSTSPLCALLAVKDSALGELASLLKEGGLLDIVHFSGTAQLEGVHGFHPLMSFSDRLLTQEEFSRIHFVGTAQESVFRAVLPFGSNSYHSILPAERALYHANCVSSGNFVNLLWRATLKDFRQMGIPQEALFVYLEAVLKNFESNPEGSLTGPMARKDTVTIAQNLNALGSDFRGDIYRRLLEHLDLEHKEREFN